MIRALRSPAIRHFLQVSFGLVALLIIGVMGYVYFEGFSWPDAFYMTFITFSTVGYGEVQPVVTVAGRILTMGVILSGLALIALMSATITSFFVQQQFIASYKQNKMKKQIQYLHNHIILCGGGDTGRAVVEEFHHANRPLVVIDKDEEILVELAEHFPDLSYIVADATKDETLIDANIHGASALITALTGDTANLFVVISARAMNPNIQIIARSVDPHTAGKMHKAGADQVVSPNLTEGMRMAATVLRPNVVGFLDVVLREQGMSLRLEEVNMPSTSPLVGQTLKQLAIPEQTGLIVVAVKKPQSDARDEDSYMFNPGHVTKIDGRDCVIVLGDKNQVARLRELLAYGVLGLE